MTQKFLIIGILAAVSSVFNCSPSDSDSDDSNLENSKKKINKDNSKIESKPKKNSNNKKYKNLTKIQVFGKSYINQATDQVIKVINNLFIKLDKEAKSILKNLILNLTEFDREGKKMTINRQIDFILGGISKKEFNHLKYSGQFLYFHNLRAAINFWYINATKNTEVDKSLAKLKSKLKKLNII